VASVAALVEEHTRDGAVLDGRTVAVAARVLRRAAMAMIERLATILDGKSDGIGRLPSHFTRSAT
jgi:hypothetical protein